MVGLLTTFHVLIAVVLILVVLLQSARGTDIAGAFGGMGSQAAFGPRGTATFLSKATVVLAILFMLTAGSLAILANRTPAGTRSVLGSQQPASQSQPGTEGTPAPATSEPQVNTEVIPPTSAPSEPAPAPK
ncbi:MAG: preprotein translocase subunit SecG [Acidobacteria bacterium]|nr:preprotein translocase subunit SecG [Acidobacteriota bacterium]